MMKKAWISLLVISLSSSLYAAEYFSILDSGLSPSAVAVGNISNFGVCALDVLDSPVAGALQSNGVSVFYANMMASDLSYMAMAGKHNVNSRFSVGGGLIYEKANGGNETSIVDGDYTALGTVQDMGLECVGNLTYMFLPHLYLGVSGHLMYRDVFGARGFAPSVSTGLRFESKGMEVALTGKYLNNPVISYSNGGEEARYAQLLGSVRRKGYFVFPMELLAQGKWIPTKSDLLKGAGVRVHLSENLSVSGGYMDTPGIGKNHKGRVTAGVGLNLGPLSLDYAFNQSDYVDNMGQHKVALTVRY